MREASPECEVRQCPLSLRSWRQSEHSPDKSQSTLLTRPDLVRSFRSDRSNCPNVTGLIPFGHGLVDSYAATRAAGSWAGDLRQQSPARVGPALIFTFRGSRVVIRADGVKPAMPIWPFGLLGVLP
jgi:hypothetical protein